MPYKNKEKAKEKNKEYATLHKDKMKEAKLKYYLNNKNECIERATIWNNEHPERRKEIANSYSKNHRKQQNEYRNKRREFLRRNDPHFVIEHRMEVQILKALKNNKQGYKWELLVGYTSKELKEHLEFLFTKEMNWDRFLKGEIHIDHIIPKSLWIYSSYEDSEFKQCWALCNLQPLWAKDNINKRNKVLW